MKKAAETTEMVAGAYFKSLRNYCRTSLRMRMFVAYFMRMAKGWNVYEAGFGEAEGIQQENPYMAWYYDAVIQRSMERYLF